MLNAFGSSNSYGSPVRTDARPRAGRRLLKPARRNADSTLTRVLGRRRETDNRLDRDAANERTNTYAVPKRGAEIRKKKMTDPELIAAMSSRILRDVENYEDFVMTHVRRMFETNAEEEDKANDDDDE